MKVLVLISTVVLLSGPQPIDAHPLRYPERLIGYQQVDLTPLFNWWAGVAQSPDATNVPPRPLSAWERVVGTNTETVAYGWILDATIEESPGYGRRGKILLRHPPTTEQRNFNRLMNRLTAATRAKQNAEHVFAESSRDAETFRERAIILDTEGGWRGRVRAQDYYAAAARERRRANDAANRITRLESQIKNLNEQLDPYPPGAAYVVDFFALRTGEFWKGMPVYDVGRLLEPE